MSSAVAAFVLRRSLCRPRFYSSLASRVLTHRTLAKVCPAISVRLASSSSASSLAVAAEEKVAVEEKVTRADKNLLRVLESKIETAEDDEDGPAKEVTLPDDFPFEIIDNSGDGLIILKRELAGESIQVTVSMEPDEDEVEDEDEEDDDEDRESSDALKPTINLQGTINRGTGPTLEFSCSIDSGRLVIDNISVKGPEDAGEKLADREPDFWDLDETLEKALRKYLSARGINASLYDSLLEYMRSKDDKEYAVWLKNLKEFVEK